MINYVIIQALASSPSKLAYRKYMEIPAYQVFLKMQISPASGTVDDTTCCFKLTTSGGGSKSKRSCKAGSHRALWMARMKWITEIPWYTSVCMSADWGKFFGLRCIPIWYGHFLELKAIASRDINGIAAVALFSIRSPRQRSWEVERPQCPRAAGGAICPWVDTWVPTCWQVMFLHRAFLDNLWTSLDDLVHFQTLWMKMIQLDYWTLLDIRIYITVGICMVYYIKAVGCYGHIFDHTCMSIYVNTMSRLSRHSQETLGLQKDGLLAQKDEAIGWLHLSPTCGSYPCVSSVSHWWACCILPSAVWRSIWCCMDLYGMPWKLLKWQNSLGMANREAQWRLTVTKYE